VIKSRKMRWAGHVARMGKSEMYKQFCRKSWKQGTTWNS